MGLASGLRAALSLLLLGAALYVLHRELHAVSLDELWLRLRQNSPGRVALAVVLTLFNYAQLTRYDALGLRYLGRELPLPRLLLVSFVATAFARNIGPSVASGGSVRYRFYSSWGLSAREIATLIAFLSLTFFVGFSSVAGVGFSFAPDSWTRALPVPSPVLRGVGIALLSLLLGYFVLCWRQPSLRLRGRSWSPPRLGIALGQLATAGLDWLLMSGILLLLLPAGAVDYLPLLLALLVAQVAGVFSQVPGGLGVFESILLTTLGHTVPTATLLSTLLLYRTLFFFMPLGFSLLLLFANSVTTSRHPSAKST